MSRIARIAPLAVAVAGLALAGCQGRSVPRTFDEATSARLWAIAEREVAAGNIPGAVVLVGQDDDDLFYEAFGRKIIEPTSEPMSRDTIFDIASLSKPVSTATCVLILVDRGQIGLEDHVTKYLPAFAQGNKQDIRIKHLLAHCSGLPSYTNAASLARDHGSVCPDAVIEKICSLDARSAPEEEYLYSCLNYITLGRIVEIVSGQGLDAFARENLFAVLGMNDTYYNPPASLTSRIAATQVRSGVPDRGIVHDPLAKRMGGVSGNAGVFTTAKDLATFCRMLLNGGRANGRQILSGESVRRLTTPHYFGRAYGFDVNSSNHSWIKGHCFSEGAFCHSGYTGTSLVCDPTNGAFVIILTNRAHPNDKGSVRAIRTDIADAACEALQE